MIVAALTGLAAVEKQPFEETQIQLPGRVLQVVPAPLGRCAPDAQGWLAASVRGHPPDEERSLTVFACEPVPGLPTGIGEQIPIPEPVVAFDVADVDPAPGFEIVLLSAAALEIRVPRDPARNRTIALPFPAPLPARTRELSRMHLVDAWNGNGRPLALVPTAGGGLLVDFDGRETRPVALPLLAHYRTPDSDPPAHDGLLTAEIQWPHLKLADDNGDGLDDLFALSRYAVWIYHMGPDGLPAQPSRRLVLRPFDADEELRHDTTGIRTLAGDVDGDGIADLLVDTGAGTLIGSHHLTEVYRNRGDGVSLDGGPDLRLAMDTGMASIRVMDLDGDGRPEFLQTSLKFGIGQVFRMLTSRSTQLELATYSVDASAGKFQRTWEGSVTLRLDLARGRIADILPNVDGDWNGDGRPDLLYGVGARQLGIRLGAQGPEGPRFGSPVAEQDLSGATEYAVGDLDGDGLDDLMLWDPRDGQGTVRVMRNRGTLPGTRPALRAFEADADVVGP